MNKKVSIRLLQFVAPILFCVLLLPVFAPTFECFEFDYDEGLQVMLASLVVNGYEMYSEIWSDHPPLFVYLQATSFYIIGPSVGSARFVVLILAAVLIWAIWRIMRLIGSATHAFAAVVIVIVVPYFLRLSVSSMIGLPSISMAMVSLLCLAFWHRNRKMVWLLISAVALSLSILIKFYTAFLALIFVIGLLVGEFAHLRMKKSWYLGLWPAVVWSMAFCVTVILLLIALVGPLNFGQLVEIHLGGLQSDLGQKITLMNAVEQNDAILLLIATVVGIYLTLRNRRWLALYLSAWFVAALGLLLLYGPVWYHQTPLVTVPGAMLAGYGLGETICYGIDAWRGRSLTWGRGVTLAIVLFSVTGLALLRGANAVKVYRDWDQHCGAYPTGSRSRDIVDAMASRGSKTGWVVTDRPMIAFRAGLLVPPDLVVMSLKRLVSGDLTESDILATIQEVNAEQILFGRYDFPMIEAYLESGQYYDMVYKTDDPDAKLYVTLDDQPERVDLEPVELIFEEWWGLVGATFSQRVRAGNHLWVALSWQKLAESPADYQVSLWLEDLAGHIAERVDKKLPNNLPAQSWSEGTVEPDYYLLPVDPSVAPGSYLLKIVLYDAATGRRLAPKTPAVGADLAPILGEIRVEPALDPPDATELSLPYRLHEPSVDGIRLIGFDPGAVTSLRPGDRTTIMLWWQVEEPSSALLMVSGLDNQEKTWPLGKPVALGNADWPLGSIIRTPIDLRVPAEVESGGYNLGVRLLSADSGSERSEIFLTSIRVVGRQRNFSVSDMAQAVSANFDNRLELLGYAIDLSEAEITGVVKLELFWQAQTEMDTAYKVFVHFIDEEGQIVAQVDREPQAGEAPTAGWLANEIVADQIVVPISKNLEQVRSINVGLYNPVTGERLPVLNGDRMEPDTFVSIVLKE